MKSTTSLRSGIGAAILLVVGGASPAPAQVVDSLVKGKALYAEASYDDALRVLGTNQGPEAHQYRALCFLALGKTQDAEGALEALIAVSPEFALSETDSPPRLVSMFAQTKRRLMPAIVRKIFSEARDEYQAKELDRARVKFERVLALSRDPAITDAADLKDLQILTAGYLEIVKNTAPPAPTPSTTVARVAAPASAPVVSGPSFPSAVPSSGAAPASTPAAVPTPPSATAPVRPRGPTVVAAVIVRQTVPSFMPVPGQPAKAHSGTVKVVIGTDGKVKSATLEQSVEPHYDIRLLAAARSWFYKPATLNGQPIESEKLVSVTVGAP